jgi:hypothetical protein
MHSYVTVLLNVIVLLARVLAPYFATDNHNFAIIRTGYLYRSSWAFYFFFFFLISRKLHKS